jgi:putative hydrolase of the HAD superfamily
MVVRYVLFDLYGTLVDVAVEEDTPAFWSALATDLSSRTPTLSASDLRGLFFSILRDERSRVPDGFVLDTVFRRLLTSMSAPAEAADVARLASLFRRRSIRKLRLRPYVDPLLKAIRDSGCKTGIISNTEGLLTRFDISQFPLLEHVDTVLLSSEVGVKKPEPQIFQLAMERLREPPEVGVFVGNNIAEDIVGAQRAGLRSLFMRNNGDELPELPHGPAVLEVTPDLYSIARGLASFGWNGAV